MNKFILLFFGIPLILTSCFSLLNEHASWDFLQEANFVIDVPYKKDNELFLPFTCDLKKYNSAPLEIKRCKVRINNDEINIYLIVGLAENKNINEIKLGKINSGIYNLYYIDVDKSKIFVSEIIIK